MPAGPVLPTPELPTAQATPAPPPSPDADLAFGAYQRGYYETALKEAMKRIAADKHDGAAMTLIGQLYEQGYGVKQDDAEAARWYAAGAAEGNAQSMFAYGLEKLQGKGVKKDIPGAADLFRKAAAKNHPGALYNLGMMELEYSRRQSRFQESLRIFRQGGGAWYLRGRIRFGASLSQRPRR